MNSSELDQIYRANAWRHFAIHADQRLKMFQFYITISTALFGAGIFLFRAGQNDVAIILLGLLALFFSFVFWKLDVRTSILVKNAEDAIKHLDESIDLPNIDGEPNPLKLFTRDDFRNSSPSRVHRFRFSYRRCFALVFVVIGCLGILGIMYCAIQFFRHDEVVNQKATRLNERAAFTNETAMCRSKA